MKLKDFLEIHKPVNTSREEGGIIHVLDEEYSMLEELSGQEKTKFPSAHIIGYFVSEGLIKVVIYNGEDSIKETENLWIDDHDNSWAKVIHPNKEEVLALSATLKDCWGCYECSDCVKCRDCRFCKRCFRCILCEFSEDSSECTHCVNAKGKTGEQYQKFDKQEEKQEETESALLLQALVNNDTKWIPCSERLPNEDGEYLITLRLHGIKDFRLVRFFTEKDKFFERSYERVLAWMSLPKCYEENENEYKYSVI